MADFRKMTAVDLRAQAMWAVMTYLCSGSIGYGGKRESVEGGEDTDEITVLLIFEVPKGRSLEMECGNSKKLLSRRRVTLCRLQTIFGTLLPGGVSCRRMPTTRIHHATRSMGSEWQQCDSVRPRGGARLLAVLLPMIYYTPIMTA